jgi:hypothetical protein
MCALEILKYLVSMDSVIKAMPSGEYNSTMLKAARITVESQAADAKPSIMDALEILKFLVSMDTRAGVRST